MEQRYATSPEHVRTMTTDELRERFLVTDLFVPGQVNAVYTHHDRVVLGGAVPTSDPLPLPTYDEIRSQYFCEHRELGVVNVGAAGTVNVDGEKHELAHGACLYVGRGARDVVFTSDDAAEPAAFYLFSAPAHAAYPTTLVRPGEGTVRELGDQLTSNRRTLNQYIHADGVKSCQIVMGVTTLHPGSMWNTLPAHTHDRRTECYLYFDLPADARVVHLMGRPDETRHLVVADKEAVISPSWSVHSGVGTAAYSFVWAMAGENQTFDDMDGFPVTAMR
ncbi:5-dehydro-4-deoxy-D-glucuronate isomerase [Puerhibacterium puerhi]|uniref:5-dehydro-4-deoxy-D-glucuronate isomerase n=1 Tax=Puerhibacterium puerhi TaxID=2692623 RepID=UPI001359EBED|nr:5-dehydro-4-deoxy-D-glucuronate isomerase [Puerhibacterium puerhi]